MRDGRVLVVGGENDTNPALADVELYDPATKMWGATGSLHTGRDFHTATLLPDGRVLVVGGASEASVLGSAEVYDRGPACGPLLAA